MENNVYSLIIILRPGSLILYLKGPIHAPVYLHISALLRIVVPNARSILIVHFIWLVLINSVVIHVQALVVLERSAVS